MTNVNRQTGTIQHRKMPGFTFGKGGQLVSPDDAKRIVESRVVDETKIYNGGRSLWDMPATGGIAPHVASNTVEGPASIVELARALKNDPQLIFQFVHDNIEWEPGWGVQKGALGCLMDGMGNAFDQCMLMVALLRQAGLTANYVQGTIQITQAAASAWFNTESTDIWGSVNYCANMNIPGTDYWDGSQYWLQMSHVWVSVQISGTYYVFDPSYKTYNRKSPVSNLATMLGYNASTFLSDAESGATIDPSGNYVQNMNRTNIRSDLQTFATNLATYIKGNTIGSAGPGTAQVDDILGGQAIVPITIPQLNTTLSYEKPGDSPTTWTGDIPTTYKTTLQVQFPDNSGGWCINQTFTSDQLAGGRLSLFFNGSLQPVLYLNGTAVQTGIAQGSGTWNSIFLTVTHNAYSVTWYNQSWWQSFIYAGEYYLIANAWGNLGRGQANYHQQQLNANLASGGSTTSESVLGEALSTMWFNWVAENSRACDLINRIMNCHTMYNHQVGIVGHNGTPLTDLGGISATSTNLNNDTTKTPINDTVLAMHGVALEATMIQQIPAVTHGVCTTKIIDTATSGGAKIYKGTSSNWSGTVSPALSAKGYTSSELNGINSSYISAGDSVLIADNPSVTVGSWTGFGYWGMPSSGAFGIISGTKGGSGGDPQPPTTTDNNTSANAPDPNSNAPPQNTTNEPIDLSSGNYLIQATDLINGSQGFPYQLGFTRRYNSRLQYATGPLGRGWTHDFAISAKLNSDGFVAMGSQYALQAVASIAELFVATDLLSDSSRPVAKLVVTSLSDEWWIDQLTNNTVTLQNGEGSQVFALLPDGTYAPPLNNANSLTLSSGLYTLKTPQGATYNFNTSGQISTIVYPNGVTITYNYTSGILTSVSNGLGRTLTLHYTGNFISSVTDGTGRSVGYTVDANNDLTTVTDPNSQNTTYSYDNPGRLVKIFKPANPTVPVVTNVYDSLSRVKTQTDAIGNLWTYYFAGSRTEEMNPNSYSTIYYFDRNGSLLSSTDALLNKTSFLYDGLERLVQRTLPEGNYFNYTYDSNNNILTVTAVPKVGSGLSNVVNTFTYDPTWKKVKTAKDGNSNITTYTYDPSTSNLLTLQRPMVGGSTPTVAYTYNARGQILTITDETGIVTKNSYDTVTEKLLTSIMDYGTGHFNLTATYGYDSVGNLNSIEDANSNITTFVFDSKRRVTQRTAPTPFSYITNYSYDANDNLTQVENQTGGAPAWQIFKYAYTSADQLWTITDPANNVTTYTYDTLRRPWTKKDALLQVTTSTYDADNRLYTITDPSSTICDTRTYTNNGKLSTLKDARNNVTTYSHDGFDRLDKTTFPDTSYQEIQSYDANGNVLTYRSRSSNSIGMTYDVLNRLLTKTPTGQPTITYGYDLAGRQTSASKPVVSGDPSSGELQFFFDTAGRFYKEEYPDGKTITHVLDSNGNITKTTYPDGYYVSRVYDQLNRMTTIKLNGSSTAAVSLVYDEMSRRTQMAYANGVTTNYTIALDNDLTTLAHTFVGSSLSYTLGYNAVHQINSQAVTNSAYMWHPGGGGTSTYGTASSVNEYPTVGGASYSYDGNANFSGDGTWTYTYDTENHMLTASKTGTIASFVYDSSHRQAQKTVGSTKTRYIYSGLQRIADYDGVAGTLQNRWPSLVSTDSNLAMSRNYACFHALSNSSGER